MKKVALKHADEELTEYPDDAIGVLLCKKEGKIILHYTRDDEYCYYLITDEEEYEPGEKDEFADDDDCDDDKGEE